MRNRILVVDDDVAIRFGISQFLRAKGFDVAESGSCTGAVDHARRIPPDVAILDFALPDGNAFDVIPEIKSAAPTCAIIVLTGHGSVDLAVKTLQLGADHFLTKPVELPALQVLIERLVENQRNRQKTEAAGTRSLNEYLDPFIGTSAAIRHLAEQVEKVRDAEVPILIEGETGTGKGILAAWMHRSGTRSGESFVDLNCAGLSKDLLESELFGHEKGSFTGAVQTKRGLFEIADRGTVFLDEIGDVDIQVQPKLLKVLEERRFRRLGDLRERFVDVRLISATHQPLGARVKEGHFRSDLYFRISTVVFRLPPLRDRSEDIPLLVREIAERIPRGRGVEWTPATIDALRSYAWPGNLRELRNVIERALLLVEGGPVEPRHLQFQFASAAPAHADTLSLDLTLDEVDRVHILRVLEAEQGSVERAAVRLGVPRNTLYYKLKKHGIPRRTAR